MQATRPSFSTSIRTTAVVRVIDTISAVADTFAFPPSPLSRVETDRAVSIARAVSRNGNMMLTAAEASLVCRYLLHALRIDP